MTNPQHVHEAEGSSPPPGAASTGLNRFFEAFHLPRLIAMRSGWITLILVIVVIGQVVVEVEMSKNSGPVPYFVERDPASGAVWVSDRVSEKYTPQMADITFQLRRWAIRFQDISLDSHHTLNDEEPAAYHWTVGAGQKEFNDYFDKQDNVTNIVTDTPGTSREITENSTSYSPDGKTAFMIITRQWKLNGADTHTDTKLLRINFILAPETLKPGEDRDNPLGVRIPDFGVSDYYGPGATK